MSDDWLVEGYRARRKSVKGTNPRKDFALRDSSDRAAVVGVVAPLAVGVILSGAKWLMGVREALGVCTSFSIGEDSTPSGVSKPGVEETGEYVRRVGLPQSQHACKRKTM